MAQDTSRGRHAARPSNIPARGWRDIAWRVKDEVTRDHVSVVSAGVAFFGLLAIFPAIGALISIAGLIMDPATIEAQLDSAMAVLPENAAAILREQARQVVSNSDTGLGFAALLGVAVALYGASKGMGTLIEGMNIAYDEEDDRGLVKQYLISFALTLVLIFGLVVALAATVVIPALLGHLGLPRGIVTLIEWGRWPLLAAMSVVGLAVLYRYGPARENPKWRWVTWGSALATVLWIVGSIGFAIYVRNFGSYDESYGALGGVIILLTWLWLSAYIVLLGAEINSEIEHQTRHDTTTGDEAPMGSRGAVKADRVGPSP